MLDVTCAKGKWDPLHEQISNEKALTEARNSAYSYNCALHRPQPHIGDQRKYDEHRRREAQG